MPKNINKHNIWIADLIDYKKMREKKHLNYI